MDSPILLTLRASLFASVLALGLRATFQDACYLLRRPRKLSRALLSMNGIMLLFAVTVALSFRLQPSVKLALVALSVSPVPPILPYKALKAGAAENYTIGLLVAAALASIVLIPVCIELLERVFGIPLRMSALTITALASSTILVPLGLGIVVNRFLPNFAERVATPLAVGAIVLLLASVLPILYGARGAMASLVGNGTLAAFVAFTALGLAAGQVFGGPEPEHRTMLALSTAARHPAVALAIARTNFPDERGAPAAVLLYLLVNVVMSALYLAWRKRRKVQLVSSRAAHG